MQRWLLTFSRGEGVRFVGHLDLVRCWERAFRRANLALAYSHGFRPHPKIAFAAPLPMGVLGTAELLDLSLEEELAAAELTARVTAQLPMGLSVVSVQRLEGPSLPSRLRHIVYRVGIKPALDTRLLTSRIASLLAASELPRTRQIGTRTRHYDLRSLVNDVWLEAGAGEQVIAMRLRADNDGAGRADEVLDSLGVAASCLWTERSQLSLAD